MRRLAGLGLAFALLAGSAAGAAATGTPAPGAVEPAGVDAPLPAPFGRTSLLSKTRAGGFPNGASSNPVMSTSGRYVAFESDATDLVANDVPNTHDVFLLDRDSGKVTRVPLPPGFARNPQGRASEPAISADGRVVAYTYQPPPTCFVPTTGTADGCRLINHGTLVVAWARGARRAEVVSLDLKGSPAEGARQPTVSGNGTFVAYTTANDVFGQDDGGDDVLRFNRNADRTVLVSVGGGISDSPSISGDGNLVAFVSDGGDTVVPENTGKGRQVFVRDVRAGTTAFVSRPADGNPPRDQSADPAISGNGRYVVFASAASNMTPEGGPGLYRRELAGDELLMVSVKPGGGAAGGAGIQASVTPDGNAIAWTSTATDLVPEITGQGAPGFASRQSLDVFLRDMTARETVLISIDLDGRGSGQSAAPSVAGGGRFVAFFSRSPNLVRKDGNEVLDVFLRDLPPVPVLDPTTLDLGAQTVDTVGQPVAVTLRNRGWSPLGVTGASRTGANPGDFRILVDGCKGRRLARDQPCTVTVRFEPKAKGTRTATLAISDSFTGSPRTAALRGRGLVLVFNPKVELSPPIGRPGIVTILDGTGFPPNGEVTLAWNPGDTPGMDPVVADAGGRIHVPVLVFHNDVTGRRELRVAPASGTAFSPVAVTMLVTKPTVIPPRFDIIRIVDLPLVLVIRG